tara:strand:+ start:14383 stop:15393 length:1011 start_codon:yes stop_codon:yes gene_type:complete
MENKKLRVGIIGCGELTTSIYLPIINSYVKSMSVVALCDKNTSVLKRIAQDNNISFYSEQVSDLISRIDLAIIVVPNAYHFEIAKVLIENNINVLIEKPATINTIEIQSLIQLSSLKKSIVAVGHVRRYYQNNIFIKQLISNNTFGKVTEVQFEEGYYVKGFQETDTFVNKSKSGGGVLIDLGPHLIDLLFWWFGESDQIKYYDDDFGSGVEGECFVTIQFKNNIKASGKLSKTRDLKNKICFEFEHVILTMSTKSDSSIELKFKNTTDTLGHKFFLNEMEQNVRDAFVKQLMNIENSIRKNHAPKVGLKEAMPSVNFIDYCYQNKLPLNSKYDSY